MPFQNLTARRLRPVTFCLPLLLATPLAAQRVEQGRTLYDAAFFVPFAPVNALRLTARLSVVDTRVEDPYTGLDRRFSGNRLWLLDTGFRQDLDGFAWGVNGYWNSGSTTYRRNEEDRNFRNAGYFTAFAELRPDSRTTVTLAVDNLTGIQAYRERRFFTPDRTAPAPFLLERRERNQHIVPSLSARRSFG